MVKKKPAGQEFIFLGQYLERLLNWKLWIDKAEELLAGARVLEPLVRSLWDIIEANFKEERLHINFHKIYREFTLCSLHTP